MCPSKPESLAWNYEEGDKTIKTYVWVKNSDFVVIMKKYPDGRRRLITSFYVDRTFTRRDFERKDGNRSAAQRFKAQRLTGIRLTYRTSKSNAVTGGVMELTVEEKSDS